MTNFNRIYFLSFFIFTTSFSLPISSVTSSSSHEIDLDSLLAFKSSLNDPNEALNSWNQTTHYCNWTGIFCDDHKQVLAINLGSQGLVGSLSPYVGNLSFLRFFNLGNNTFHGQIPQELGRLTRLTIINFINNSFIGPIPNNLSRCTSLVNLNFIGNKLSGTIPEELGHSLYKLESLDLAANSLSGPIPSSLGNLTSLRQLGLVSCIVSQNGRIPESLVKLTRLENLYLSDNSLTGTVPSALFNISTLVTLSLSLNQLQGSIPSSIGLTLPKLQFLHLYANQFTGTVPASLSNASSLREIIFSFNYFTGLMPRVAKLSLLQHFGFAHNPNIEDDATSFISSFTNCTNLGVLDLGHNLLHGSLPDTVANLSRHLITFGIYKTQVHGPIPSGIENLVGLTRLFLNDNNHDGPIPLGIVKLSNVRILDLGGNRFTNELPSSFGNLTSLIDLHLDRNIFFGTIPTSLGNCTQLLLLELSYNNFNGPIPREIMSLSSLSIYLNLSYNALTGSIPYEVGSLRNLGVLDLSNNRLSGVIPSTLTTCMSLEILRLEGNVFEGQIPSGLSSLMGLRDLDLSRNDLSGSIPSFLGQLNLTNLNISFNKLHGEVPMRGVFTNATAVSLEGNSELCGGVTQLELHPCNSSRKYAWSTLLKILIPTCSAVVALFLCFIIFVCRGRTAKKPLSSLPSFVDSQFLRLSYGDLQKATGGFSESNLIGVGRFGSVYKGILVDGATLVAVKVLNLVVRGASKSFMAECNALRGLKHRNLVKILSVCESIDFQGDDFKALVYEFKANGCLEKWLHYYGEEDEESGGEMMRKLSIIQRLNIAIDIAQAIEYLHCGTDSTIIHGDLKPSNILLDGEMTACVGDFGLAKIVSQIVSLHESSSSIGIRGTLGYIPPEYGMNNSASTQGDVYSYGIVLLEIFTSIRPTNDRFKHHENLHSFISAALPDNVMETLDPVIQAELQSGRGKIIDYIASILGIGVACSREMPRDRMSIVDVVRELHKLRQLLSL